MSTLYIDGPMTGLPELNRTAFFEAEQRLAKYGYPTFDPTCQEAGQTRTDYMCLGISDVLAADSIAVLPGWEASRGARLEARVAVGLGLPILGVEAWIEKAVAG